MSGETLTDKTTDTAETEVESPKSSGFFRGLFRSTRIGRNGDSNLRETIEELIEQHEEAEPQVDPVAAERTFILLQSLGALAKALYSEIGISKFH